MKAMLLSLLAVALAATAQVHGATVTIDNTTECTLSQYLTSTGKSIATGDDVVFAGSAAVTVTTELSGLTGKITIRDGATLIAANSAALGTADGETWVETGATLKLSSATKAGTVLYDETLHLAGTLRSEEPESSVPATNCIWPHKWILEGDAQISSAKQRNDFTKIEIDQQGKYLLTIGTCSQYANFSDCTFTNPYRVKVTGYGALNIQGSTVLNGDANCRFSIDEGATIWGYYWGKGENTSLWTLEAKGSAVWAKNWPGVSAQSHDLTWQGPIVLEEAALRVASGSHTLALKGKISGAKSLGVPGKESSCNLALYNADNDFTGGINLGANSYLDVEAAGAIPGASDCKPVAMGAGGRVRFCYADTSHPLPDFTISGSGVMHQQYNKTQRIYSGGWRTVTKSGDGELSWNTNVGADKLVISNGSVCVYVTAGQTIGNNVATLNTGIPTFSGIVLAGGNFNANGVAVPYGTLSGSGSVLNPDANATLSGGIRVTAAELLSDGWSGIAFDGPLSLGGEAKVTIDDPEALDRNGVYRILTTTAALNVQSLPVEGDASGRWQTRLTSDGKGLELYRTRRGLLLVVQ